jgi:hypothetical protein
MNRYLNALSRLALAAALTSLLSAIGAAQGRSFIVDEGGHRNVLYRDNELAAHVLITGGGKKSRVIFSFPPQNSGVGIWFEAPGTADQFQIQGEPVKIPSRGSAAPALEVRFDLLADEAVIRQVLLDSVRSLRDFNQGYYAARERILTEALAKIKDAPPEAKTRLQAQGVTPEHLENWLAPARRWIDQGREIELSRQAVGFKGGYHLLIRALDGARLSIDPSGRLRIVKNGPQGGFALRASVDFAPLTPLEQEAVLNARGHACVERKSSLLDPSRRNLAFLSYREKFLAGSWQYLTYFGRDTLIALRILSPVLSKEASAIGLKAVLDRVSDQGEVAHEEDLGDQVVLRHLEELTSALRRNEGWEAAIKKLEALREPLYDYKMIDGEMLLPPLAQAHLSALNAAEAKSFLSSRSLRAESYGSVLGRVCGRIARLAEPYAKARERREPNEKLASYLISLKPGQEVGDWRDSLEGLGGGRYPLSVNVGLVSGSLRSCAKIVELAGEEAAVAGDKEGLERTASSWDHAHEHFLIALDARQVRERLTRYLAQSGLEPSENLALRNVKIGETTLGDFIDGKAIPKSLEKGVRFWSVALDAKGAPIPVQSSDIAFSLSDLTLNEKDLNERAALFSLPYPLGLSTPVGLLVANPALSDRAQDYALFGRDKYHGIVIWSWPLTISRSVIEEQLSRKDLSAPTRAALQATLSSIEAGEAAVGRLRTSELWKWTVTDTGFSPVSFGAQNDATESNAVQLWSNLNLATECRAK